MLEVNKNKRNFIKNIFLNQKVLALLGLVIIVLISFPLAKSISQRYKIDREIKDLEAEIAELENRNINLKEFIDYLESDQFVEEQARLKLGLKKPDEEVVVIKTEDSQTTNNQANAGSAKKQVLRLGSGQADKPISNLQKWWDYFFHRNDNIN